MKAVLPGEQRATFPSALAPAPEQGVRSALGPCAGDVVAVDGAAYVVGRAALDAGAQPSWANDRAVRLPAPGGGRTGLLRVPGSDVRLYAGLPLTQYAARRDALRDLLWAAPSGSRRPGCRRAITAPPTDG